VADTAVLVKRSPVDELLDAAEEAYVELLRVFEEHEETSQRHEEVATRLLDVAQEIAERPENP
jgi:cell division septum initiation protein DivIVA